MKIINITSMSSMDMQRLKENGDSLDALWMILTAYVVLTMQSGFALLESGMISRKSEANVMVKNMLGLVLGGTSFWFVGYGLAFGSEANAMVGKSEFLTITNMQTDGKLFRNYFSHLALATTATSIISGAIADRVSLKSFMVFAFVFTGFIYPLPAHWIWDNRGWLNRLGAYDFAGCCAVHISGGSAALVACILTGPRFNRYVKDEERYFMSSPTNVMLGTFFLWWGWLGFNCGSTFAATGGAWKIVARIGVNTMNGAIGGGVITLLYSFVCFPKRGYLLKIPEFSAGILGGLVAITSSTTSCEPWQALLIGIIGGFLANLSIRLIDRIKIDDPVGVIGVHLLTGYWGMIAVGLFGKVDPVIGYLPTNGLFYCGGIKLLGYNIVSCIVTTLWSGALTALIIGLMKLTIGFRMSLEDELKGADEVEHNIQKALHDQTHTFGKRISKPQNYLNAEKLQTL